MVTNELRLALILIAVAGFFQPFRGGVSMAGPASEQISQAKDDGSGRLELTIERIFQQDKAMPPHRDAHSERAAGHEKDSRTERPWEPVIIKTAIKNNTKKKMVVAFKVGSANDIVFSVTDSSGELVPRTAYGKKITSANNRAPKYSWSSGEFLQLTPGKNVSYEIDLSRQFDLSEPGMYAVQATRKTSLPGTSNQVILTSKRMKFEVME